MRAFCKERLPRGRRARIARSAGSKERVPCNLEPLRNSSPAPMEACDVVSTCLVHNTATPATASTTNNNTLASSRSWFECTELRRSHTHQRQLQRTSTRWHLELGASALFARWQLPEGGRGLVVQPSRFCARTGPVQPNSFVGKRQYSRFSTSGGWDASCHVVPFWRVCVVRR